MEVIFDIEANGLLNNETVDYTSVPYKLKPTYLFHCLVIYVLDTKTTLSWGPMDFAEGVRWLADNATHVIGHNIIDYDLLALKMGFSWFNYTILPEQTLCSRPCKITDTLVMSKTLNPDRLGHSIEWWGNKLGCPKIDWRAKAVELGLITASAPKGAEFATYHPEMLNYCIQDVKTNAKVYEALLEEKGEWPWDEALLLETEVRDIITVQSHRGFHYDVALAEKNVLELDTMMQERKALVEPHIPPKRLTKTALSSWYPPLKQFTKSGEPSALMVKFCECIGATLSSSESGWTVSYKGKVMPAPLPQEPLETEAPAEIDDTTHIKGWLVTMGWVPSSYKERDLTCDSKKKKLTQEKFLEALARYKEQTLSGPFEADRVEHLCTALRCSPKVVWKKVESHDVTRPLKALTNPVFTVGQDKEICPKLLELSNVFPYAKQVVEYLTFKHRRNSILGGGEQVLDSSEDDEEGTYEGVKGFLPSVRADGRISTPADTVGAGTSRFKHRGVCNIPRVTSLYGAPMRAMFGTDSTCWQLGYDFDSLEAKIEAHWCWRYDEESKEYCNSLTLLKPNDCHSKLAEYITTLLGRKFDRGPAKSVKYACAYNAQPPRVAKTIGEDLAVGQIVFDAYWEKAWPLKALKERMIHYWETKGGRKFLPGLDGRKLPIRAKGNCINTVFQSSGVICAKRAMVLHWRKLHAHNLIVDFFRDSLEGRLWCQQLIAYHDEAQLEVSKGLVQWRIFKTKEEAEAYKAQHVDWSDIGHTEKGWYVGKCLPGILAVEAVRESGEWYKLNVELTAGYMLGTNWATCH